VLAHRQHRIRLLAKTQRERAGSNLSTESEIGKTNILNRIKILRPHEELLQTTYTRKGQDGDCEFI